MRSVIALVIINSLCFSLYAQLSQLKQKEKPTTVIIRRDWPLNVLNKNFKLEEECEKLKSLGKKQDYVDKRIEKTLGSFLVILEYDLKLSEKELENEEEIERLRNEENELERILEEIRRKRKSRITNEQKKQEEHCEKRIEEIRESIELLKGNKREQISPRDVADNKILRQIIGFVRMYQGWTGIDGLGWDISDKGGMYPFKYIPWFNLLLKKPDLRTDYVELVSFLYCIIKKVGEEFFEPTLDQKVEEIEKAKSGSDDKQKKKALDEKSEEIIIRKNGCKKFYDNYAKAISKFFLLKAGQNDKLLSQYLLAHYFVSSQDIRAIILTPREGDKKPKIDEIAKSAESQQRARVKKTIHHAIDTIRYWLVKAETIYPGVKESKRYSEIEKQLEKFSKILLQIILKDVRQAETMITEIEDRLYPDPKTKKDKTDEAVSSKPVTVNDFINAKRTVTSLTHDMLYNIELLRDLNPTIGLSVLSQYNAAREVLNRIKRDITKLASASVKDLKKKTRHSPKISTLNKKDDVALISSGAINMGKKSAFLREELLKSIKGGGESSSSKLELGEISVKIIESDEDLETLKQELSARALKKREEEKKRLEHEKKGKQKVSELEGIGMLQLQGNEEEQESEKSPSVILSPRCKVLDNPKYKVFMQEEKKD